MKAEADKLWHIIKSRDRTIAEAAQKYAALLADAQAKEQVIKDLDQAVKRQLKGIKELKKRLAQGSDEPHLGHDVSKDFPITNISPSQSSESQILPDPITCSASINESTDPHQIKRIYFLTQRKGGSQWIRNMLFDFETHPTSGLDRFINTEEFDFAKIGEYGSFLAGPLYGIDFTTLEPHLRKEDKVLFVLRDPRDVVVSYFYSVAYSHVPKTETRGGLGQLLFRKYLLRLQTKDQLCMAMFHVKEDFDWWSTWNDYPNLLRVRYEDFLKDTSGTLDKTFQFFNWKISKDVCDHIAERYSFETSSGRKPGEENIFSHFRKGVAGGWREFFDRSIGELWENTFPGLLTAFGYESDNRWYESLPEAIVSEGDKSRDLPLDFETAELLRQINFLKDKVTYLDRCCAERLQVIEELTAKEKAKVATSDSSAAQTSFIGRLLKRFIKP